MSANNQVWIIRKGLKRYEIYLNACVDNAYDWKKHKPYAIANSKTKAYAIARKIDAEYGIVWLNKYKRKMIK